MLNDFDITEFSDLHSALKDFIRRQIAKAEASDDVDEIRNIAGCVFEAATRLSDVKILFTNIKDFTELGTSVADAYAGIHVFRTYFAHRIHDVIRKKIGFKFLLGQEFEKYGIFTLPDFLDKKVASRIISEISKIPSAVNKQSFNLVANNFSPGDATFDAVFGNRNTSQLGVSMRNVIFDSIGRSLSHKEVNQMYATNTFVQKLHNKHGDGDIQKILHQDTFFPCLKFWYFPKEVTLDDGPFTYAPESNRLTEARLEFIYKQSINCAEGKIEPERTESHMEGSIRIFDDELTKMGYTATPYPVAANTLVVANVFGFHRRSEVMKEGFRDSIHGSIRLSKPFEEN